MAAERTIGRSVRWRLAAAAMCCWAAAAGCDNGPVAGGEAVGPAPPATSAAPMPVSVAAASDGAATTTTPVPRQSGAAASRDRCEECRTSDAWSVFGEADIAIGAPNDPESLRVWLGPRDAPGALWKQYGIAGEGVGRVLDVCVREEAYAGIGGRVLAPGEPISGKELLFIRDRQRSANCLGSEPGGTRSRWFYLTELGKSPYFDTRAEAQQWRQDQRDASRNTLPYLAWPFGVNVEASGLKIAYSDIDDPIDEVRVLADSVNIRNGALRGAVRNWSRHLWAYRVVVSAGGREWAWPLSIQPGEAAPFEFDDWDGPADPAQIQIDVGAHMSVQADISRSIEINGLPYRYEYISVNRAQELLNVWAQEAGYVEDMAGFEDLSIFQMTVDFEPAESHPSFADDTVYNEFERRAGGLRAFYAYTEPHIAGHTQTKIHDVVELTIFLWESVRDENGDYIRNAHGGVDYRLVTIDELPFTDSNGHQWTKAELAMAGSHQVGRTIWIGSEHSVDGIPPTIGE